MDLGCRAIAQIGQLIVFVMAGSLVHYWFMLTIVVPYQRVAAHAPQRLRAADPLGNSLASSRLSS